MKGSIMNWKRTGLPLDPDSAQKSSMSRSEFDAGIQSDAPVLVNFFLTMLRPQPKMKPMLEELNQLFAGKYTYLKLNADENDALLKSFDVNEIPAFYLQ